MLYNYDTMLLYCDYEVVSRTQLDTIAPNKAAKAANILIPLCAAVNSAMLTGIRIQHAIQNTVRNVRPKYNITYHDYERVPS